MKRTILSLLLVWALVLGLIPAGVRAEGLSSQMESQTEVPVQEPEVVPEASTIPEETITADQVESENSVSTPTSPEQTYPTESLQEKTIPEETLPAETIPVTQPMEEQPEHAASVTVFFTVTVDGTILSLDSQERLASQSLVVPNFDLTPYGMENRTESVTLAHLLIYATEVLFCGLEEENAGAGYLAELGLLDTDVLTLNAIPEKFWELEGQLLCFVDAKLWAELEDPDCAAIALEEGCNIHLACIMQEVTVKSGVLTQKDGVITAEAGREVFYVPVEEAYTLGGDVRNWYSAGTTDELGQLQWVTPPAGEYYFATPAFLEEKILSLPAVVSFTLETEESAAAVLPQIPGDVNGDGVLDQTDGASLAGYINGSVELAENDLRLADMNGDGKINMLDVALIYRELVRSTTTQEETNRI